MSTLVRIVVIVLGLCLAAGAGLIFIVVATLSTGIGDGGGETLAGFAVFAWLLAVLGAPGGNDLLTVFGMLVAILVVLPVMMPGTLVALLAEAFGWRSLTLHMTANAAIGALAGAMVGLHGALLQPRTGLGPAASAEARALLVLAATGAVVGLVYWLVAGRNASGFLARTPTPVIPPPTGR